MSTPGTPTWLRTHNDRAALRLFLEHGALSRSQLGELSGLSKPTAGQMIARLERLGLVAAVGESTGARGPNAVVYGARSDSITGVAVSMRDDVIEAVVVDPTAAVHPTVVIETASLSERSPSSDVGVAVRRAATAAGRTITDVRMVIVGVQAAVDTAGDTLAFTDTLPGWPVCGARAEIEAAHGFSVVIDNDVNLATVAERASGNIADESFALVWLGEGLGAGVDVHGTVQHGAFGAAGEVGYLEVPRSAVAIDPEAHDFTDLLGGPGIRALARLGDDASLAEALARVIADEALDRLAVRIGLLLAPIIAVADPATIVLGGPTGRAGGDRLAAMVAADVRHEVARAAVTTADRIRIRTTAAGDDPVLDGARSLVVARLRDHLVAGIAADADEAELEGTIA